MIARVSLAEALARGWFVVTDDERRIVLNEAFIAVADGADDTVEHGLLGAEFESTGEQ